MKNGLPTTRTCEKDRQKQTSSTDYSKTGLTRNKLMLCVWWDWKGIIHYELLPPGKTINSDLYCQQLMRLKQEVEKTVRIDQQKNGFFTMITPDHTHL
ncbi:Mariner Mos1 transposase [Eumeta japonica]|uniref:Mariner Mos1 transposase n=1 Tax=Eumeta variegata TaxID=151549 RepID=A0A4C1VV70_EUMVA|nr:Mariner Mos1 transposase [Eumeta japonica]